MYQKGKPPIVDELARYERFLRRELPAAVCRELEITVEKELSPVEDQLKNRLINIVRDLQLQLFQTYTRSRSAEDLQSHDVQTPCNTLEPDFAPASASTASSEPTRSTVFHEELAMPEVLSIG
jgi:hypothetical protein